MTEEYERTVLAALRNCSIPPPGALYRGLHHGHEQHIVVEPVEHDNSGRSGTPPLRDESLLILRRLLLGYVLPGLIAHGRKDTT